MAGELWRRSTEIGHETTPGTAVAGTRLLYLEDLSVTDARAATEHRYSIGTPDNVLAVTQGSSEVGGSASMVMSADEILEFLDISIAGGVTPTTPGGATLARLWTYVPSQSVNSATFRYNDGARTFIAAGMQGNQLTFAGSATGDATLGVDFFGRSRVTGSLTGSLTARNPSFLDGWRTNIYIDAFGATAGTTLASSAVLNHSITYNRNLGRKYFYGNTQAAGGTPAGNLEIRAQYTFEASATAAGTELAFWESNTPRLIRIEHIGPVDEIETGQRKFVTIDVAGHYAETDLAGTDGDTRTYQMTVWGRYDATNAYTIRVRAQNSRTALY